MPERPLPSFVVVIPMYNESRGAEACVRLVCQELTRFPQRTALIVVNDGSTDGTGEILLALELAYPKLIVVSRRRNGGYGAALRTGTLRAGEEGFEYALFMDSDLTNQPRDIARFASMMEQNFDVIKATRYSKGGSVCGVPLYRLWISRAGNRIARALFRLPISDATNGFRAVRVALLAHMQLREEKFPIIMEELYWSKFLARSFAEVPVTLTDRSAQLRPTSFVYRPSIFYHYLKYPIKAFLGLKPRALASGATL
jgi:glycosyltransferase involved in cell wall biosynthesis